MNGIIISFLRRTKSDVSLSEFELFECNNTSDLKYNRPMKFAPKWQILLSITFNYIKNYLKIRLNGQI